MDYLLQILGSVASIGSIPLAIYLYLRSREAKYFKLRQDIARVLSFQIGEERELSTFEIQAVIDSKIRENKLKPNSIKVDEIVEDLVSETISSPLLDRQHKSEIIKNLQHVHQRGRLLRMIDQYDISHRDFLMGIQSSVKLTEQDAELIARESLESKGIEKIGKSNKPDGWTASSTYGLIMLLAVFIGGLAQVLLVPPALFGIPSPNSKRGEIVFNVILGFLLSVLAILATYAILRKKAHRNKKEEKEAEKESS
jgi:hypothetical protein